MLLFAVPLYLAAFFGWLIYAGLIKKNIKQNMQLVYIGSFFSVIWILIAALSYS
ncbi:hypothetical protein [Pedobacter sp. Leaf170]|uniref:hypothetical protein n=1 Tax=Pedobacter sp. Leaf170 TaxID=2876558 RepID=UPI001E4CF04B|nr:hypothetical protein [Pedobacter sp. Leaf170]